MSASKIQVETFLELTDQVTNEDLFNMDTFF